MSDHLDSSFDTGGQAKLHLVSFTVAGSDVVWIASRGKEVNTTLASAICEHDADARDCSEEDNIQPCLISNLFSGTKKRPVILIR